MKKVEMDAPIHVDYVGGAKFCAIECERQKTGPIQVGQMFTAWHWALATWISRDWGNDYPSIEELCRVALLVEPEKNGPDFNHHNFRQHHVGFMGGGSVAHVEDIEPQMQRLWDRIPELTVKGRIYEQDAEMICKTVLQIHPWGDGNGRTVAILWNWITGRLNYPTKLPKVLHHA